MNIHAKKIDGYPESYSPKVKPEILKMAEQDNKPVSAEELQAYIFNNEEPPKGSYKIKDIRRLWHDDKSENFYLEGCLTAVMKAIGEKPQYDYPFFLALCGSFFVQPYCFNSGSATAGFSAAFNPGLVKHVLKLCGYDCMYIDCDTIKNHYDIVIHVIKTAVNKNIPVITKNIGNAQCGAKFYDILPEWSNIGGYGEKDVLFVNVFPEGIPTDEYGYIEIIDGLKKSRGLFILGEKFIEPNYIDIIKQALYSIPMLVSMPDIDGFSFGQKAYYDWANGLLKNEDFTEENILKDIAWQKQNSPFVANATMGHYFRVHYDRIFSCLKDKDYELVTKIKDIYNKMGQVEYPQTKEFLY